MLRKTNYSSWVLIFVMGFMSLNIGCASHPGSIDPYENVNRKIFKANIVVDKYTMKPLAQAYKKITPAPVNTSISNFFSNIDDATNIVHDLLQGKFEWAIQDFARVLVNSTIGVAGLFDVTDDLNMALPKHPQDTGITLARWGVPQGPYLMLPFLGASTLRDASGIVPNYALNPVSVPYSAIGAPVARTVLSGLDFVDKRATLLSAEAFLIGDKYVVVRDGYLNQRHFMITGHVLEKEDDFLDDDEDYDEEADEEEW